MQKIMFLKKSPTSKSWGTGSLKKNEIEAMLYETKILFVDVFSP